LDVDIRGLGIELDSISKQNSIGNMLQYQISSLDVKENSKLDVDIRGLGIELDPISSKIVLEICCNTKSAVWMRRKIAT
jgi:hypothetical protein